MARKASKTRADQYREILAERGIRYEDCRVLAFAFNYQMQAEMFHFGIMAEKVDYFLFDAAENTANIIIPKDGQDAEKIAKIAQGCGGRSTTPKLM